jgi:hypothetical protein
MYSSSEVHLLNELLSVTEKLPVEGEMTALRYVSMQVAWGIHSTTETVFVFGKFRSLSRIARLRACKSPWRSGSSRGL